MIAVIAHDRRERVSRREVAELAEVYVSLRGAGSCHYADAGGRAQFVKIDSATADRPGIERTGSSWVAAAGVVRRAGTLIGVELEALEGQFALVSYDSELDELRVASDPFGMHPIYRVDRDNKTYISNSALTLAKHLCCRPDQRGIELFMHTGYQIGRLTHWENVERVGPATLLSFSDAGVVSRQYWRPLVDDTVTRLSFDSTVQHALDVVVETYRTQYAGRSTVWADLTGGYDTRLTTLALARAGAAFVANTSGDQRSEDVRLARLIAETAGWAWTPFFLPDNWATVLPGMLPISLAWGDGTLDVIQLSETLWRHAEKARTTVGLLIGGGHEHFRGHAWQQELLNAGRSDAVNIENLLAMRWLSPITPSLLTRDSLGQVREYLRASAALWVEPYRDCLNTTKLDILHLHKNTGHFGPYSSAAAAFLRAEVPFYTRAVCTAAISAHYKYRNRHRLMRHMIARLNSHVAAIETSSGGPAEPYRIGNLHRFLPYYAVIGRKALYKVGGHIPGISRLQPRPQSHPLVVAGRRAILESLALNPATMRCAGLFQSDALARLLQSASEPAFRDTAALGRIITVELALERTGASL